MEHAPRRAGDGSGNMMNALEVAKAAVAQVGDDRVELVTITTGRVSVHPASLADGEDLAHALGLNSPLDHRMMQPGYTMWCGDRDGYEFQVRGALRQPIGAVL